MFKKTIIGLVATAATLGAVLPAAALADPPRHGRHYRHYDNGRHNGYYRGGYRGGRRCYDKGNGGLVVGGVAGGLLGNAVAGNGDRTLGTVVGAAAGALAGRAIDKSDGRPC